MIQQHRHELNKVSTETLRGITYELLSHLNVDSQQTPFHNDLHRKCNLFWDLTPDIIRLRDQAMHK